MALPSVTVAVADNRAHHVRDGGRDGLNGPARVGHMETCDVDAVYVNEDAMGIHVLHRPDDDAFPAGSTNPVANLHGAHLFIIAKKSPNRIVAH